MSVMYLPGFMVRGVVEKTHGIFRFLDLGDLYYIY